MKAQLFRIAHASSSQSFAGCAAFLGFAAAVARGLLSDASVGAARDLLNDASNCVIVESSEIIKAKRGLTRFIHWDDHENSPELPGSSSGGEVDELDGDFRDFFFSGAAILFLSTPVSK